jgi:hypothetical protein
MKCELVHKYDMFLSNNISKLEQKDACFLLWRWGICMVRLRVSYSWKAHED